ncbi:MAG: hypothetical protein HOP29_10790 [Phycisphaerales bacterium]|nr:hypothetical protein [Phycisphaerales bacterium]
MRTIISLLSVAVVASAASAQDRAAQRTDREIQRSLIEFRLAADSERGGHDAMALPDGQTIYVSRKPILNDGDVAHTESVTAAGRDAIQIDLTEAAAGRIAGLTADAQADRIAVLIDGKLVVAPVVASALTRGRMQISGLTTADADRVMNSLSSRDVARRDNLVLVPSAAAGTAADTFHVEIFANNVKKLRGYQITLDAVGGDAGSLKFEQAEVDTGRGDYIFGGTESYRAINPTLKRIANALPSGGVDGVGRVYLGTYTFKPTADAKGTFRIVTVNRGNETVLLGPNSEALDMNVSAQTTISIK